MAIAEREVAALAQSVPEDTNETLVPEHYRWTREQFHEIGETGLFEGQRVILIEGEILVMPPIGDLHAGIVTVASAVLRDVFGKVFLSVRKSRLISGLRQTRSPILRLSSAQCASSWITASRTLH